MDEENKIQTTTNEKLKITNDVTFQLLFGKVGQERITKKLLERILKIEIDDLTLDTNKRLYGDTQEDKIGRLDIKAKLSDGTNVIVEMQVIAYDNMPERFLYYWSKVYSNDLRRGEEYNELNKTISIIILAEKTSRLEEIEEYHSTWRIREDKRLDKILTDDFEMHIIELNKFDETKEDTEESNWINFIKRGEIDMSKNVDEELQEAIDELNRITADPETREMYYQREKDLLDKIWGMRSERKAGIREGMERGKAEEKEAMIKAMYEDGLSVERICKISNMKKEEVQKILAEK